MTHPQTYIIYGANSPMGAELANFLAPHVQQLILFYHKKQDRITQLLTLPNVFSYSSDILDFTDFMQTIDHIRTKLHIEDIGAVYLPALRSSDALPLTHTSLDLTSDIINLNFIGAIHFLKGIFVLNRHINSTRIVLIGSHVSRVGLKNGSVYAATKAALANLSRSVAMEEGAHNTLINTVSPGPIETDHSEYELPYSTFRKQYFDNHRENSCLGKLASNLDICNLVAFLTSMENTHITGEEIFITGGS